MTLHPMIAALRKHKAGVILIALQIAVTLAIICNATFIIGQRIERVNRLTGLDESNLFLIQQRWADAPNGYDPASLEKLDAMQRDDLAVLRNLPEVASVTAISTLPLTDNGRYDGIYLKPDQQKETTDVAVYTGGEQILSTLGLQLIAGRTFTAADVRHQSIRTTEYPVAVIVSKAVADKLYPHDDAIGKAIYLDIGATPSTIIGVVGRLQTPHVGGADGEVPTYNSLIEPMRRDYHSTQYAVRAKPGRELDAMRAARTALFATDPLRVIDDEDGIRSFSEIRARAYQGDIGMAVLMGVVCLILLGITALGIVGLTSFWVGQRRRQIGIRRALGARKQDILRYFQAENLIIAGGGAVLGIVLAISLNLWLITRYEMDRLPVIYVLVSLLAVLVLGQLAVLVPARRASNVPPVVATRSV